MSSSEPRSKLGCPPFSNDLCAHKDTKRRDYVVIYENGYVTNVFPELPPGKYSGLQYYDNRDIIYGQDGIFSDSVEYDLTDIESIYSIDVPDYTLVRKNAVSNELGVTGALEYVLRAKSAEYWNRDEYELSIACLEKATQLMKYSTVGWPQNDFFRIVNHSISLGRFKAAQNWKSWIIENTLSLEQILDGALDRALESCKSFKTNLVIVEDLRGCCAVCAKYRKRVYRTSLKNNTLKNIVFPKFPDDFHFGCGLGIYAFIYGLSEPAFKCDNIIKYSNRRFVDDRDDSERAAHERLLEAREKSKWVEIKPNLNHIIYRTFKPKYPDIFPKSLSAFTRMKNANSKKYQELISSLESYGEKLPESIEDVIAWGK